MIDIVLSDENLDWEEIRKKVEIQVLAAPDLVPEPFKKMYDYLKTAAPEPLEFQNRSDISDDIRQTLNNAYKLITTLFKPVQTSIDEYLSIVTDRVIEFIMTGKSNLHCDNDRDNCTISTPLP